MKPVTIEELEKAMASFYKHQLGEENGKQKIKEQNPNKKRQKHHPLPCDAGDLLTRPDRAIHDIGGNISSRFIFSL
jgi:hypothetical protein